MYFFFSGEGATDFGTGSHEGCCEGEDYRYGPLTLVACQMAEERLRYSFLEYGQAVFVARAELERIKPLLRRAKRSPALPGKKSPPETALFYRDARAFCRVVAEYIKCRDDKDFVAVLFRDSDSELKKDWEAKRRSVLRGFDEESLTTGVAAIARPVSEAWWLSAIYARRGVPHQPASLESTKRGRGAEHALKRKLTSELGTLPDQHLLNESVSSREIDWRLIDAESFMAFRDDFETSLGVT